jgi:hypothetical protein
MDMAKLFTMHKKTDEGSVSFDPAASTMQPANAICIMAALTKAARDEILKIAKEMPQESSKIMFGVCRFNNNNAGVAGTPSGLELLTEQLLPRFGITKEDIKESMSGTVEAMRKVANGANSSIIQSSLRAMLDSHGDSCSKPEKVTFGSKIFVEKFASILSSGPATDLTIKIVEYMHDTIAVKMGGYKKYDPGAIHAELLAHCTKIAAADAKVRTLVSMDAAKNTATNEYMTTDVKGMQDIIDYCKKRPSPAKESEHVKAALVSLESHNAWKAPLPRFLEEISQSNRKLSAGDRAAIRKALNQIMLTSTATEMEEGSVPETFAGNCNVDKGGSCLNGIVMKTTEYNMPLVHFDNGYIIDPSHDMAPHGNNPGQPSKEEYKKWVSENIAIPLSKLLEWVTDPSIGSAKDLRTAMAFMALLLDPKVDCCDLDAIVQVLMAGSNEDVIAATSTMADFFVDCEYDDLTAFLGLKELYEQAGNSKMYRTTVLMSTDAAKAYDADTNGDLVRGYSLFKPHCLVVDPFLRNGDLAIDHMTLAGKCDRLRGS